jgi:ATP-binding cassette subfamily B protein
MKQILRILRFARKLWRYYLGVSIFTILMAVVAQMQPLFTKGAIDQITNLLKGGKADVTLVAVFAILIFVTDVLQTLLSNFGGYLGDMLSVKLQRFMSQRYYEHLLSLPQAYFDMELTGKIINRMNRGIYQIADFIQMMSNNFLQFIFSTIFSLLIVAYYSWQVALMLLALYPIFIILTAKSSNRWQKYQKTINLESDEASGRFAEAINQVRVVKSYLQESRELNNFKSHYRKIVSTTKPQSRFWHRQDIIRRLILNFIFLIVFVYIFVETAHGVYGLGTMVLLIQYAMLIRIPIFSISFLVDQSQRAVANTKDYFKIMDIQPAIADHPGARPLKLKQGKVSFENVSFGYDHELVLKNISFTLLPNTKVALVGESGEGKTTISSLLLRFYEVTAGRICIDGQDINTVTQSSVREAIGVVFQDPALFSGTIRENIAYANPLASEEQVIAAAKDANAHEFIVKYEKGYDSEIGEHGVKLSGGQKQRIAIARAILKDAPILILDEATSSLDSRSEQKVQQALNRLMENRTTLIIAHRLSTIQHVDTVITLKNGKIDEIGAPEELAKTGGIYAQLLNLQQVKSDAGQRKLKEFGIAEQ